MDESSEQHHRLNYVEIPVTDLSAAKEFYGQAFGWAFNDYGPGPDYVGIRGSGDSEVGGFRPETEILAGGPLLILFSTDLAASVEAVKAAGGEIALAPYDFPGGRRFHFRDPSGNELAVWAQ